jgi:excisionase family DNA binding protein
MDISILKSNPELAKDLNLTINGKDLLTFADQLVKETANEIEAKLKEAATPDKLLTRQEVAKMLGVTLTTLFHWNNKGILPTIKIGNKVRYRHSDIEKLLNKSKK